MRLLPYERVSFRTEAPPQVVETKLAMLVGARGPFSGTVQGRHFELERVLGFLVQNSFQPVIVGDVVEVPGGTEVRVRMRLSYFVGAFAAFWFGALFIMSLSFLFDGPAGDVALMPLGMMLFGYALVSGGFWFEVMKARRILAEGLGCREVTAERGLVRR